MQSLPFPLRPIRVAFCLIAFLAATLTSPARAQQADPPTRRAEAVEDESAPAIPAAPPVPDARVPRAEPVNEDPAPPEKGETIEKSEESEKETKPSTPTKPAATPPRPKVPAPEQNLFDYANMVYGRKAYDLASTQYTQYLNTYPNGAYTQIVLYRLAESQLNQSLTLEAEATYRQLIQRFRTGDYVANAAYRLGSLAYNRKTFEAAAKHFDMAATQSRQEKIRFSAIYYKARSLSELNQPRAAYAEYEKLAKTRTNNPFWDRALIQMARADESATRPDAALSQYARLARDGTEPELVAEALVKSARLLKDGGKTREAVAGFERVLELKSDKIGPWQAIARYGLVESYYKAGEWMRVLESYAATEAVQLPEDQRPRLWLMVGDAQAKVKQHRRAIDLFQMIDQYYPASPENAEASYRRLLSLNELRDPALPSVGTQVIARIEAVDPASPQIDLSRFIIAEHFFTRSVFAQAAQAYKDIRIDKLPENLRQPFLFRRGWACQASGDAAGAIASFSQWIEANPEDPQMPQALAKRGMAYKATEDWKNAQSDFDAIIEKFPTSPVAELAYEQSALVRGQRKDTAGMIATFKQLLKQFPTSRATAEAHFWIGSGHFELKQYTEALPDLIKARDLDTNAYEREASLRILLCHYYQSDVPNLVKAVEAERIKESPNARVPRQVYQYLGLKFYEQEDMPLVDKYLSLSSTPGKPEETDYRVWLTLSEARLANSHWDGAVAAADNFLLRSDLPPPQRAKGMLNKARALYALKRSPEATPVINEALRLQPEARVQAHLRLLLGDIALRDGDPAHAAAIYVVPSQMFDDEEITPLALSKTIHALEKAGKTKEAEEYRVDLKKRFPDFRPPQTDAIN
ncbi:MAG: tetratricopeptide repeat protein [Verrucomicrobiales bacterium]